ncbi:MAG: cation transporter [Gammaproteobacteria bacterium]|nr:cation transporter [Gammaproteobacteria bacterium]
MPHTHIHNRTPQRLNKAFAIATALNLAFTIIEAVYAVSAHSMSLLADAGHNLGDVLGLLFAWLASWLITKKSTARYSYGFKRTTILAAIFNSLILVATSSVIAYESIVKIIHPTIVNEHTIIIVAAIGIVINAGSALLFMHNYKEDLNIKGAFLHLAYDSLISVGVVVAGLIILVTGWTYLDPIIGLGIVVVIIGGTWRLLLDSVNLILDAVPRNIDAEAIQNYLESLPDVHSIHDLHIWALSTNETALTCHLVVPRSNLIDSVFQEISCQLSQRFNIKHTTLQAESAVSNCTQECKS